MSDSFYNLTPDHILDAIEQIGMRSTGRAFALNSLENRVYEVEMEDESRVVGKFYRPGRWARETILEEHQFIEDLAKQEIPVAQPLLLKNKSTLDATHDGILFAVFPKLRGRAPEELNETQLLQLGRFLARIHNVGAQIKAPHRPVINSGSYGQPDLDFLSRGPWISLEVATEYKSVAQEILDQISPLFEGIEFHRIHGDCHLGNLLFNQEGHAFFLDFDDMMMGPAVQDIWLLTPGKEKEDQEAREIFLKGYTEMREFDRSTLRLVEPLRSLRIIHYSAWIAKRWVDPAFPRIFPDFNTHRYWEAELRALTQQRDLLKSLN